MSWILLTAAVLALFRFQELEEALILAEQHLDDQDSQLHIDELQQQVDQLQADLQEQIGVAQHLHQELQTAEQARQQAGTELFAAAQHQRSLQVNAFACRHACMKQHTTNVANQMHFGHLM